MIEFSMICGICNDGLFVLNEVGNWFGIFVYGERFVVVYNVFV